MIFSKQQFRKFSGVISSVNDGDGKYFSGINDLVYRWPNGQLPYALADNLTKHQRKIVEKEIKIFNR